METANSFRILKARYHNGSYLFIYSIWKEKTTKF